MIPGNSEKDISFTAWSSWIILAFFTLYIFSLQTSITVMINPLKKDLFINDTWIGLLAASSSLSYTIMQIPIGPLVDKFGTRKIAILSIAGCTFFNILFSFSENLSCAILARFGIGFFSASAFTCAFYSANKWFKIHVFTILVAFTESLANMGGILSTKGLSVAVTNFGWRYASLLLSIIGMVILAFAIGFVKDKPRIDGLKQPQKKYNTIHILGIVLRNRQLWLVGVCCGLLFAPLAAFAGLWGVPFLMIRYNIDVITAGKYITVIFLGSAIFNPFIATIGNLFKNKIRLMQACSVMLLVLFIIIIYIPVYNSILLYILYFMLGMFSSCYILPFSMAKSITKQKVSATALALTNVLGGSIGYILIQPLIGWIIHMSKFIIISEEPIFSYYIALLIFPILMILLFYVAKKIKPSFQF